MRSQRSHLVLALFLCSCGPVVADPSDETSETSDAADTLDATSPSTITDGPQFETGQGEPPDPSGPPPITVTGADETTGTPPPDMIACDAFDPARVYLRGTLSEGASYRDALTDPTDPDAFCVGFANYANSPRIRPSDQRVLFIDEWDGGGLLAFEPDPIAWTDGYWDYPGDPYANDELLLPTPCDQGLALFHLLISPADGGAWYSCAGEWFDPDGTLVYAASQPIGVAITPDNRLLVNNAPYEPFLFLVAPGELPGPDLVLPRAVDAVVTGRVHEDGLWLVAVSGWSLFRWRLTGDEIVEEGEYSDFEQAPSDYYAGKLDAAGDFFHISQGVGDTFNDVIVRRRLAPDPSEIIYSEDQLDAYAVRIHISELFTGP